MSAEISAESISHQQAGEGKLNDDAVLREQAARMLKDRRTHESVESFVEK